LRHIISPLEQLSHRPEYTRRLNSIIRWYKEFHIVYVIHHNLKKTETNSGCIHKV